MRRLALAALLVVGLLPAVTEAQMTDAPASYAGDLWSRPRLTGDWFEARDWLLKRGLTLDVDLLQILQGVSTGGKDKGDPIGYGGTVDYRFFLDTGKLGLWPGGFLTLHAMSNWRDSVNEKVSAIQAVNSAALFPTADRNSTQIMNLTYAQFLTTWFGVVLGKIETLTGDVNEFAHDFRTQFQNLGFQFNLTGALTPISALGGGIIVLPFKGAVLSSMVLDPDGRTDESGFEDFFQHGVTVATEFRVTVEPFGLVGHQTVGGTWSNKQRIALNQDPDNLFRMLLFSKFPRLADPGPVLRKILERFFPGLLQPVQPLNEVNDAWNFMYNFDQYLWHPGGDKKRGIGVFFRFGVSDGDANPIKYHYSAGIGGKGVVPGRPNDTFGIGWSRIEFSDHLLKFLRTRLRLGLDREDAIEMYYNVAVTPWLGVTADLQIVDQGLKKQLQDNRIIDVDTAVIGGLRVFTRF